MTNVYSDFFGLQFRKAFAVPERLSVTVEANQTVLAAHAQAAQNLFAAQATAGRDRVRSAIEELSGCAGEDRIGAFAQLAIASARTQAADFADWGRLYLDTWSNLTSSLAKVRSSEAALPEAAL